MSAWLRQFTACEEFFGACPKCSQNSLPSARECTLNLWAVQAAIPACSCCSHEYAGDVVIQVRRSSYHDVVKVQDISRLADIAGVQAYTINGSKVVFLRRRPQPRPPKGAQGNSACTVCSRHLQDVSAYCSLQCKLDALAGVKHVSLRPPSSSGAAHSSDSGASAAPDTPSHLHALRPLDTGSDSDASESHSACSRRKACPRRSHFE